MEEKMLHAIMFLLPDVLRKLVLENLENANELHESVYGNKIFNLIELDETKFTESEMECLQCFNSAFIVEKRHVAKQQEKT